MINESQEMIIYTGKKYSSAYCYVMDLLKDSKGGISVLG